MPNTWSGIRDEYSLEVASGVVTGFEYRDKFGASSVLNSGGERDIWDQGAVTYSAIGHPATASNLTVQSASTSDTAAGTGARTLTISYLDANWVEQTASVTLNGTSAVTVSINAWRVWRAFVTSAGSGGVNAGDISIRSTATGTPLMAVIPALKNQTFMSQYTVPANKGLYLDNFSVSIGAANPSLYVILYIRKPDEMVYRPRFSLECYRADITYQKMHCIYVPEKSDVVVRGQTSGAGTMLCRVKYAFYLKTMS